MVNHDRPNEDEVWAVNDRLAHMFRLQGELQRDAYGRHPRDIDDAEERIQFIKDMRLALDDELSEFFGEIGWKPWATSRHINYGAAKGELVDAFHFFMNLCMAIGMTPAELYEGYLEKRQRNIKRQEEGYDGVRNKCPRCKRDYDDIRKTLLPSEATRVTMITEEGETAFIVCFYCAMEIDSLTKVPK